ncbi:hypothetical protein FH972_026920 [Carpinus fangiana]|uniref:Oxysterol-binding protein n=1 Tax=Carpinus fangiana TaxID=176857 RepID=A0A5N6L5S3_9ROSI|nr:hypothetical protein FH972_026920 [Carpinus fangiana]
MAESWQGMTTRGHFHRATTTLTMPLRVVLDVDLVSPKETMAEASAVPPQAKGSWMSFVKKSLASFNGDLSSMTAPPFILSTTSLTEYSSYWAEHPPVFVAPAGEQDAQKRAMLVLKWFLTTLKQQYSSRSEKLGSEKKPLNPFLGELFLGKWQDDAGETTLVSEQVSHHPPVTAYCINNNAHGVRLQGYNAQKASFKTRIDVRQVGHALLRLDKFDEEYLITLPSLHIEGLLTGSPYVELNHHTLIQSSSGFTAKIDYSGKGWLSGKKNSFTAAIYRNGQEKSPIYTVDGQWTSDFVIRDAKSKTTVSSWSHKAEKTTPLTVAPLSEQDDLETRRAWGKTAAALQKGDMNLASQEKTIIEERQRAQRKREAVETREWDRIFFRRTENYDRLKALAMKIGEGVEADKTNGVWEYSDAKAQKAVKPYREGVMPVGKSA